MVSRGEVALVLAGAALAAGAITGTIFSALIVMTLVTTLVTPPLLRWMIPSNPPKADAVALDDA
jgi:Kef-type K+ transport system membrane component KefB